MKKLLYILTAILAVASFTACDDGEGDVIAYGNKDLKILSAELLFGPEGGTNNVVVETSGTVNAVSDASWASISVNGKNIAVTAAPYSEIETRYAKVTISSGSESTSVIFQQSPVVVKDFAPEDIMAVSKGGSYEIPFKANVQMTVFADVDWITAEVTENEEGTSVIKLDVKANDTVDTRTGNVEYSAGSYHGSFLITQAGAMVRTNNWTITYEGVTKIDGKSNDDILITVGSEDTGAYAVVLEPKSAFTASGLELEDYIATTVYAQAAEGTQYTATQHIYCLPKLANDTYMVYAVGLKEGNLASGWYQYFEFTIDREMTPYEKFLGNWSVDRGDGNTDIWTITPDVEDESVLIDGICGASSTDFWGDANALAYAEFTSDSGYDFLTIRSGQVIYTFEHNTYGTCNVTLQGTIDIGGETSRVNGSFYIVDILLTSDTTAEPYPYSVTLSDGTAYTVKGMRYFGIVSAGGLSWGSITEHLNSGSFKKTTASSVAVKKVRRSAVPYELTTENVLVATGSKRAR